METFAEMKNFARNPSMKNYPCKSRVRVPRVRASRQWARASELSRARGRERARDRGAWARWCVKLLRWLRWSEGRWHRAAAEARRARLQESALARAWMARRGCEQERAAAVARWLSEEAVLEISTSTGGDGLIETEKRTNEIRTNG
jgi:hypothetical protein